MNNNFVMLRTVNNWQFFNRTKQKVVWFEYRTKEYEIRIEFIQERKNK